MAATANWVWRVRLQLTFDINNFLAYATVVQRCAVAAAEIVGAAVLADLNASHKPGRLARIM